MAPLIYPASQVTQRMTWIILLILISPNNVGFVYDRVGLRLTIYCLCFLKSKHPLFWDEILELVLGQHLLCRTTKRNIFFHDGIFKQHNVTIFVQIIIFHFKMPKSSIEDRVFSWVMHLSDLNNIIFISHVSICPKYPRERSCSFFV